MRDAIEIQRGVFLDHRTTKGHLPKAEVVRERFDPTTFLAQAGLGRRIVSVKARGVFFSQGDSADSVFYLQKGRAKLTVVSKTGKEATITLFAAGSFVGEESVAGCGWQLPLQSPPVPHSGSTDLK